MPANVFCCAAVYSGAMEHLRLLLVRIKILLFIVVMYDVYQAAKACIVIQGQYCVEPGTTAQS